MEIIRTIHPIGQGAFYSERFVDARKNTTAIVVYDCGSKNYRYLKSEISSYFQEGDEITVLFISHFDNDHVNGIQYLIDKKIKIHTVVIPLINNDDIWFYTCNESQIVKNAIINPEAFFQAERIIRVRSIKRSDINLNKIFQDEPDISELYKEYIYNIKAEQNRPRPEIDSGKPIVLNDDMDWLYIPFNFDETHRLKQLITLLEERGLEINRMKDEEYLVENRALIRDAYDKIANSNNTSLIVYSGPTPYKEHRIRCVSYKNHIHCFRCFTICDSFRTRGACLYLGDTDLNQSCTNGNLLDDLEIHLSKFLHQIGTVQLPHHGAAPNFNIKLLNLTKLTRFPIFFATHSTTNTYGHPSCRIIEQLLFSNKFFVSVNESRDSGLIQRIRL